MSPFAYLERGRYNHDLKRYESLFGRAQLCVLLYEELMQTLRPFKLLCERLGVSSSVAPTPPERAANLRDAQGMVIPPALRTRLSTYFEESIETLAASYGLDLDVWTRSG
jgi:hypothetical protein